MKTPLCLLEVVDEGAFFVASEKDMSNQAEKDYTAVLRNIDPANVLLEMGHVYLSPDYLGRDESTFVTDEEMQGVQIGLALMDELCREGFPVQSILFVDDFHGFVDAEGFDDNPDLENKLRDILDVFAEMGFQPDKVISEAGMTTSAWYLYSLLKQNGSVNGGAKQLSEMYGKASLKNGTKDEERPSCSLIDAALYLTKVGPTNGNHAITVIHQKYKPQQLEVKQILLAYGMVHPNVSVVYYDDSGEVTEIENWHREAKQS